MVMTRGEMLQKSAPKIHLFFAASSNNLRAVYTCFVSILRKLAVWCSNCFYPTWEDDSNWLLDGLTSRDTWNFSFNRTMINFQNFLFFNLFHWSDLCYRPSITRWKTAVRPRRPLELGAASGHGPFGLDVDPPLKPWEMAHKHDRHDVFFLIHIL